MAGVLNFEDKIIDLAGTLATTDDDATEQALIEGCYDVITRVRQVPGEVDRFVKTQTYTGDIAQNADETYYEIVRVDREGYPARRIDPNLRKKIEDSASIYYINEGEDPVWWIDDGVVNVHPAVDSDGGRLYYIPIYTLVQPLTTQGTSSIVDFPVRYYENICMYAGIRRLMRRMLELLDDFPSSVSLLAFPVTPQAPSLPDIEIARLNLPAPPIFNPPALSVDLGPVKPGAMYWLETEEDSELVSSSLSIIDKEVTVFEKALEVAVKKFDNEKTIWDKEVETAQKNADYDNERISRVLSLFGHELSLYQNNLSVYQAEISRYSNHVTGESKKYDELFQNYKTKYEWLTGQKQNLEQRYERLFGGRPSSSPQQGER